MQMNIAQGLAHAVKVAGNRPAISCGEAEYTWSQFAYRRDCLARGLAHLGVQRGDRIAILMLNCHRYFELQGCFITRTWCSSAYQEVRDDDLYGLFYTGGTT